MGDGRADSASMESMMWIYRVLPGFLMEDLADRVSLRSGRAIGARYKGQSFPSTSVVVVVVVVVVVAVGLCFCWVSCFEFLGL